MPDKNHNLTETFNLVQSLTKGYFKVLKEREKKRTYNHYQCK